MSLSVREALQLPAFNLAQARVLAGEDSLDRPVRWVHAAELPDIAPLLKGGELLLTTGMGLRGSSAALRGRYVRQLAAAGVAGLIIELGRNFRSMPAEMVRQAQGAGLPLIELGHETRFVEITEQVHRVIMSRQYELLDRVEAINREFSDLLLGGAGVGQILHELSQAVGNPAILENTAHQVVAYAPQDGAAITGALARWEEHSRTGHAESEPGMVRHAETVTPHCTWVDIWLRHEPWGRIHVLETAIPRGDITSLVLDKASVAIGLSVLSQSDADHLADRAASAVISDLLQGRSGSAKELLQRARNLGSDLSGRGLVAVIAAATNLMAVAGSRALSEHDRQRVRLQLRSELRSALARTHCNSLLGLDGDRVLAIVAVPDHCPAPEILQQAALAVHRAMAAHYPELTVVVGASREARPDSLQRAFEEARVAVTFGHRGGVQDLYQFGNLGTYPLLLRLAQGPELAAFVESELGALLQHDTASGAKLLPTLRAYLAHAGRKSEAVVELRIQRRTLYARLERIERILGRSLDTQETRMCLSLALQGREILNGQLSRG